jgi:hypothetical protein
VKHRGCIGGAIPYNSAMHPRRSFALACLAALPLLLAGCNALTPSRDDAQSGGVSGGWEACASERPKVCTMIYDPVCARRSDGEFADYASPCNACADERVTAWHPQTCEE